MAFASHRPLGTATSPRVVLHLDADCFFAQVRASLKPSQLLHCLTVISGPRLSALNYAGWLPQVHELLDRSLKGRAVAVQQHDDVIAMNYAAKALGVVRHMAPRKARALLEAAGGRLVHVPDEGKPPRTSYRVYREASEVVEDCVREMVGERAEFEKGHGHDEWFVDSSDECEGSLELGAELAALIRQRVKERCGLVISVGVGRNKFIAKLVASLHKPDGLTVAFPTGALPSQTPSDVEDSSWPADAHAVDAQEAVRDASVAKVPGLGYKSQHGRVLEEAGIETIGQLQDLEPHGVAQVLGLPLPRGASIHQLALGVDETEVKFSLPQSLCEQMSLATEDIGNGPGRIRVVRVGSQGAVERVNEMAGTMAGRVKRHLERFSQTATLLTVGASAAGQGDVRQKANKGAANQQTRSVSA